MGRVGIEPTTFGLKARCSAGLSYRPQRQGSSTGSTVAKADAAIRGMEIFRDDDPAGTLLLPTQESSDCVPLPEQYS